MGKNTVRFIAVLIFFNALSAFAAAPAEAPRMEKEELKRRLGEKEIVVIDVRTQGDWEKSDFKIRGAAREDPQDAATWAGKYAKAKTIVLYCS